MDSLTGSIGFKVTALIVASAFAVLAVVNIINYNALKNGQSISSSTITAMLWVNAILLVIAVIAFFYVLYTWIVSDNARRLIVDQVVSTVQGAYLHPAGNLVNIGSQGQLVVGN